MNAGFYIALAISTGVILGLYILAASQARARRGRGREDPDRKHQAPYTCRYCGAPSWIDPADQEAPPDYCHPEDHGACREDD